MIHIQPTQTWAGWSIEVSTCMNILLVEDEKQLGDVIAEAVSKNGWSVVHLESAEKVIEMVKHDMIDLYLIDINLPGKSGIELCHYLRSTGVVSPILLLTARDKVDDKVAGLDAGADDYLTKPFDFSELFARIRALSRKAKGHLRPIIEVAGLQIDPNQRKAFRRGLEVGLSKKEFGLLELLAANKGQIVTRQTINSKIWKDESQSFSNVIDVLINSLRKKIDGKNDLRLIHTIRGRGFMLSEKNPIEEA